MQFFEHVNYAASHEDGRSERTALDLGPDKRALCITGSGSRVLDLLIERINRRFDVMLEQGAEAEVAAMDARYDPSLPSCKTIGVPELMALHRGEMTREQARDRATIATRQFAKRQRTWFKARSQGWHRVDPSK